MKKARSHTLELTAGQAKDANANVSEAGLTPMVDVPLQWARKR